MRQGSSRGHAGWCSNANGERSLVGIRLVVQAEKKSRKRSGSALDTFEISKAATI